ncbi:MAG: membrane-associated protein [Betaproteobacteria bacterium]|nr:membrane-associated protein [Betaproteobacteria bacterium]
MDAGVVIPLWIKLAYTLFVLVTVAVYAVRYPLGNFLWFSDIALLAMVPALWFESSLLASMMAVAILLPEALWNVSFFGQILTGRRLTGLTDYMFDPAKPLYLRALSLFHVFLPPLLVWMIAQLGYATEGWIAQTVLAWIVLPLSYWLTTPEENVNWVYGFGARPQQRMPPLAYLLLLMIGFPALIYLPTHFLLQALFG